MNDTTALLLDGYVLRRSDDLVKTDLELLCDRCGEHLCDAEDGDTLAVLAETAQSHTPECKGDRNDDDAWPTASSLDL